MTRPTFKQLRRWWYRHLPARSPAFYHARRRGLDHGAIRGRSGLVAEIQKRFLLHWVGKTKGRFVEWDAGDGITGSHAVWLEEAGWRGFSMEERPGATELLLKHRPLSHRAVPEPGHPDRERVDLVSARREVSIRRVVQGIGKGDRPRWVILQARDPQPDVFSAMNRAGYRLDQFIHDDEYYKLQRN